MPDINGVGSASPADNRQSPDESQTADLDLNVPRKLKSMGWYWGSISPSFAAQLVEHEEGGTFLVRDSSSECYIFSMTFKLEEKVHHVRIDHCKGQFSFGRSQKFICKSIVEFVEQALEHSHNGKLLFFLHRDPELEGPARFQMKPMLRTKLRKNQSSLKDMVRASILPYIRRDQIKGLNIPDSLKLYLLEPFVNV